MGKGGMALGILVALIGLVLMWKGYGSADYVEIWSPPAFLKHLNNLLALIAVYMLTSWAFGGKLGLKLKNPMTAAIKVWALAHLLVRGDLASIVLFGGLMVWAVITTIVMKRSPASRKARIWGGPKMEILALIVAILLVGLLGGLHMAFGLSPFGG